MEVVVWVREVVDEMTPVTADIMADADNTEAAEAGRVDNNNELPPTEHDDEAIDDDELQL